jgi:hypothetical protein
MIITNYHVQHILKAYSQQLSVRSRISKDKMNKNAVQKDEVTLSQESKKMLVVDKIAHEMITQLSSSPERNDVGREILDRLSQAFGRPLDVTTDDGQGIVFKVVSETGEKVMASPSSSEKESLEKKLFDITRSIVYESLI